MKALYILLGGIVGFAVFPLVLLIIIYWITLESLEPFYMTARIIALVGFFIGVGIVGKSIDDRSMKK